MEAGLPPDLFWRITPREFQAHMQGASRRLIAEHNDRAWLAWHVATLSRAKRLPNLKSLYAKEKPKPQTWQEQKAMAMALNELYGGKTVKKA